MAKVPAIAYQQFIERQASGFYVAEQQRKLFIPRLILISTITIIVELPITFWAWNAGDDKTRTWILLGALVVLFLGALVAVAAWNQFRLLHKERILKMLIEEFFPQLHFQYLDQNFAGADFISNIGYWSDYKNLNLFAQDFIQGPIGALEIMLFEAHVSYKIKNQDPQSLFNGLIMEIQQVPKSIPVETIQAQKTIRKAMDAIFDHFKYDYPKLFASPNGHWYLFLEHKKSYLEPKGFKKTFEQQELERLLGEFYYFIQFTEVLNQEIQKQALPENDETD